MNKNKRLLVILLPAFALASLGVGGYLAWLGTPPAMPETVEEIEALLLSDRYQRLTNAEKRPYQEHINEMWGRLSKADQERLMKYVRANPETQEEAMQGFVRTFYGALSQDEAVRNAMIDMVINQMESPQGRRHRAEQEARRSTPEGQEHEEEAKRKFFGWLDKGDPQTMGYGSEIMKFFQERRKQRGLPPL